MVVQFLFVWNQTKPEQSEKPVVYHTFQLHWGDSLLLYAGEKNSL